VTLIGRPLHTRLLREDRAGGGCGKDSDNGKCFEFGHGFGFSVDVVKPNPGRSRSAQPLLGGRRFDVQANVLSEPQREKLAVPPGEDEVGRGARSR
jgi:hypothetical protein